MQEFRNVSLKSYNTFGLDYKADCLIRTDTEKETEDLLSSGFPLKKRVLIIGSGSNILFTDNFNGTIIRPCIKGIKTEESFTDHVIVSVGAGVIWDDLVKWSVEKGLGGLENLSLIPGTVGATPVQNIGAYGIEVKDSIELVKTISMTNGSTRYFKKQECDFEYRTSIFKTKEKGNLMITRVFFKLMVNPVIDLNYGSLKDEAEKLGAASLGNIRQAVINIRQSKLPDPYLIGNAGSFFKNPLVAASLANELRVLYPEMPFYKTGSEGIKLAAGWLIDRCGWRGKRIGDAGVHEKQALVLVNYGNATGREILSLSEQIRESVLLEFGVSLEPEVEVIGPI